MQLLYSVVSVTKRMHGMQAHEVNCSAQSATARLTWTMQAGTSQLRQHFTSETRRETFCQPHMRPDGQELPAAVLVEVLQHVPLSERLSSCALVCRAWAAASAAATVELEIDLAPAQFPSFQSFVRQHSMQLLALKVSLPDERPWGKDPFNRTDCRLGPKPHSRLLQLPCEQLQQLEDLALCRVFPELPPMQGQQQQQAAAALDSSPFQHLKDLMLRRLFQTSQPPMAGPQQGQQGQQWRQEQQQVLDPDSHPLQQQDADMQHISTGKSGGSSSSSSLPAADSSTLFLPHLTQLTLQYCHLSSSIHLLQLSKLQSLEEFTMLSLTVDVGDRDACRDCITNALSAAFQSMPKLLRCMVLDTLVYPSVFTALPSCLQELHIRINCDSSWGFDGKTSGFVCLPLEATQLTSLEYLNLDGVDFNPSVLLYMPQLVDIDLTDVDLERIPPGPLAADHVKLLKRDAAPGDVVVNPSCEVSVFLVAVGGLQHLQRLKLYSTHINDRNTAPLQLFSCLTASTCLTELDICLQGEQQPLPQGAVQRMFPAGRSFTQRQSLSIWSDVCYRGVCQEGSEGPHWWAIDAAGMRSILQVRGVCVVLWSAVPCGAVP